MGIETALLLGGTFLSMSGSMQQGMDAEAAGVRQNAQNKIDADNAIEDAKANARIIRRQRESVKSAANSATAGSGIDVNSKTAQLIQQDIESRSNEDIYQVMATGQQRAHRYRAEGKQAQEAGESAYKAGVMDAAGTALEGYSAGRQAGWWKKSDTQGGSNANT